MKRRAFLGLGGVFLGSLLIPKALVEAAGTPEVYRRKVLTISELLSEVKFQRFPNPNDPLPNVTAWVLPPHQFVLKVPGRIPKSFHHDPAWKSFGIYQCAPVDDRSPNWYWDQLAKYLNELVSYYDELVSV